MVPTLNAVELPNRVRIEYAEQGDRRGLPVLLLHGVTDTWRSFEPMLPLLPPSLRVIAPSQRGHGNSGKPAAGYEIEDFATDALALLDALGIERAVIAGHSMGSAVAQRVAIRQPERLLGLLLVASTTTFHGHPLLVELRQALDTFDGTVDPAFAREFQESTLAQPVAPEFVDMVVAECLKAPLHVWKAALAGILAADHSAELSWISAPTVIAWGDRDDLCSRAGQEALLAAIAGSRLSAYRNAGHALHWEDPRAIASDLLGLVGRVTG